jgi:hypothetical protein
VPNIVLWDLVEKGVIGPDMDLNTPAMTKWINSSDNLWKCRWGRA